MRSEQQQILKRRIDQIRRFTPKRLRDRVHGTITADCDECGGSANIGLAEGVFGIGGMSTPKMIDCTFSDCGGKMHLNVVEYERDEGVAGYVAYLRVPSRRAARQIIEEGRLRPQLVVVIERGS